MRLIALACLLAASAAAQTSDVFVTVGPDGRAEFSLNVGAVDLTARDAEMATPLHRAAERVADPELIRMLLARGADPHARDAQGATPLHYAAAAGAPLGVLAALLGGGADPAAADVEGLTPLHLAATAQGAALLAVAGADGCAADVGGRPALDADALEAIRREAPALYPQARAAFVGCLR